MHRMGRGTARLCRVVEGSGGTHDRIGRGIGVVQHLTRGDPHQLQPVFLEEAGPPLVAHGPIAPLVRLAVHLDRQTRGRAIEIQHIVADRVLAPELRTAGAPPQALP